MSLKLYPDVPAKRNATVVRDLVLLALLVFFGWIAFKVYDAVDALTVLGTGVRDAGQSVQSGFSSAAGVVDGVPVVGGALADALHGAGEQTGGNVAVLGKKGSDAVHHLALLLGLLTFAVPAILVFIAMLPGRIRQIRQLTAANQVLIDAHDPERRRLLAMRAAFGLSYGTLLEYTKDPLGDLKDGRHDALVDAALDDVGIRRQPASSRSSA